MLAVTLSIPILIESQPTFDAVVNIMTIRATPIDIAWHGGLSIFASDTFLSSVGDEYGWLGGIADSGELRCILPYTIVRKAMIRMVRFRVETIPLGQELDVCEEKAFLESAMRHFGSIGADIVIPATTNTIFRTYPDGAIAAPYGTYIIDLSQSEKTLWGNLHSKHRNVIRNAMKKGVRILSGIKHLDTAYMLVRDTFRRSALSFMSCHSFKRMVTGLGDHIKILLAEYQGSVQGCAVIPFCSYSAYYVYGGSILETLTGAMNFLQWEAIRLFRALGVKRYDFVGVRINPEKGSKQAGILLFKQRFGGQLVEGYMWKYSLHPLRSIVYSLAVRVLKGGDIVDREHHKLTLPNPNAPLQRAPHPGSEE